MDITAVEIRKEILSDIAQGKEGIMLLKGVSMEPALLDGTILYVCSQTDYYQGDIVFFLSESRASCPQNYRNKWGGNIV